MRSNAERNKEMILNEHAEGAGRSFAGQVQATDKRALRRIRSLDRRIRFFRWFTRTLGYRFLRYFEVFPFPQMYRARRRLYQEMHDAK